MTPHQQFPQSAWLDIAVGLDLMSVRAQIDGEAGTRLDRAIGELDVITSRARTRASLLGYRPAGSAAIARW